MEETDESSGSELKELEAKVTEEDASLDESAQTVQFEAPTTEAQAAAEAEIEAALGEEAEVDENAQTVQLEEPEAGLNPADSSDDDDEPPTGTASSG